MRIPRRIEDVKKWKNPRTRRYFMRLFIACPPWYRNDDQCRSKYNRIHNEARRRRMAGQRVQTDHIVPLFHPLVCGLNVDWNLRIVAEDINQKKSNNYWPDMPFEQQSFFDVESIDPHQGGLI